MLKKKVMTPLRCRALQRPGADRATSQRGHDFLLQHSLLPVPLHPHQRTEAARALPGRAHLMRGAAIFATPGGELRWRRCLANAVLVAAMLGCAALLLDPPARTVFYPACPIHQYLGILCPGCRSEEH